MQLATYALPTVNIERIVFQRREYGFWATFEQQTLTPLGGHFEVLRPYISELKAIQKALTTGDRYATVDGGRALEWWQDCVMCWPLADSENILVGLHCNVLAVVEHMLCNLHRPLYTQFTLERPEIEAQAKSTFSAHLTIDERERIVR